MSVKVIRPGLLTTIQDLGRIGYQKYGVIVSGAMDSYALRLANLLVGNEEGEASIEITLTGPTLEIEADSLIAITGGDLSPSINNEPIPLWQPVYVKKGSTLQFGACKSGCRTYVAFAGGFNIPEVMESRSTYLRAKIGGLKGRALKVDDVITFRGPSEQAINMMEQLSGRMTHSFATTPWKLNEKLIPTYEKEYVVRLIRGSQFNDFTEESQEMLFQTKFQVTPQSDRMGYRLAGETLVLNSPLEMISEAISIGTIQVPPDGNPIILLADRQTIGGYPKIGQMISVDLTLIAQAKPGDMIEFKEVSLKEAEEFFIKRENELQELKAGILLKFSQFSL
ncbi:biotin-dependent carboxyltransferase family protein [Halalkalibacter nanhaiisediminis]|uniref:Antagonist of KipI n=1 Tax=Halalkalibacter nanhaiisediminis TaxID=688079 RepID=A0A562QMF8_9BACI|nr:biotin-dependent carboxyltransferase family protein [Halalkalibacter nanhaiisediminis]TWI57236.1 antagonist of KipI [Halalkalibacter nanhaiisediminis]